MEPIDKIYVKSLKIRIIQLEAGKCERCLLGRVEDCEKCENEIFRMLQPVKPIPVGYGMMKDEIQRECDLRYPPVWEKRADLE